jgi:hypothetical protein
VFAVTLSSAPRCTSSTRPTLLDVETARVLDAIAYAPRTVTERRYAVGPVRLRPDDAQPAIAYQHHGGVRRDRDRCSPRSGWRISSPTTGPAGRIVLHPHAVVDEQLADTGVRIDLEARDRDLQRLARTDLLNLRATSTTGTRHAHRARGVHPRAQRYRT